MDQTPIPAMRKQPIPILGLLGAPGAGKSLVARQMASLGCVVIDADALAKQVLDEPDVSRQLADWWGSQVVLPDGRVDRAEVSQIVFSDRQALKRLESLIHPRVYARRQVLHEQALSSSPVVRAIVEDCPLLLETGLDEQCDVLVFVDASRATRLARVREERGWTPEDMDRREKNQTPLDIKRRRADYIVSNDAGEAQCLEETRRVLSQITP